MLLGAEQITKMRPWHLLNMPKSNRLALRAYSSIASYSSATVLLLFFVRDRLISQGFAGDSAGRSSFITNSNKVVI